MKPDTDIINHTLTDTTEVLGWDAMHAIWREHADKMIAWLNINGSGLILSIIVIIVYTALYWFSSKTIRWIGSRFFKQAEKSTAFINLMIWLSRLTFFMFACVSILALFPNISSYAGSVFRVYALFLLLLVAWNGLHYFIKIQVKRWQLDASLELLLNNIVRIILVLTGIYLIFAQFGINLLPILGGLGVMGLAVGFAAQDILANFISGITLLLDRPFRIGEWIRTADYEGQVVGLTLRTTRIRTRDNEFVSIPNKELAGSVVINLTHGGPLRMNIEIGVAYKTNTQQAREVLIDVLNNHDKVLHTRDCQVWVKALNDSSVDLLMRFWVSEDYIAIYPLIAMQLREQAKVALEAANIEIPFPHLQLHIDGAKGLQDLQLTPHNAATQKTSTE